MLNTKYDNGFSKKEWSKLWLCFIRASMDALGYWGSTHRAWSLFLYSNKSLTQGCLVQIWEETNLQPLKWPTVLGGTSLISVSLIYEPYKLVRNYSQNVGNATLQTLNNFLGVCPGTNPPPPFFLPPRNSHTGCLRSFLRGKTV